MKCYIYFIVNQITQERYVGQTTNFSRRQKEHIKRLKQNTHPNLKLQNAWNKYGEDNFIIEKIQYDNLDKEQLNQHEIYYIQYYDSYNNGYNLTLGGDGGDTRSKLSFDEYCFAYFGNKKYQGMTNRTAKYLKVDSSCISAIKNEKSYLQFLEKAHKLSPEQQKEYLVKFENTLNIQENKPWVKQKTLNDDIALEILCVVSTYGRGIESAICKYFGLSKGYVFHLMTGHGRLDIKKKYKDLSQDERIHIGCTKFNEWDLKTYSKYQIKEEYKDLFQHYGIADLK